jgi:HD-like signal output (HDOD) protein
MNSGGPLNPPVNAKRLTSNRESLLAITDSLNASEQILGLLNLAISNPRTSIADVAMILRRDVVLSARIIRMANSAFFVRTSNVCKTIEDALQRVGMREIARLIATVTMQGVASPKLRAYGITGEQYNKSVLFNASASQFIASEVKMDSNMAYLSGLMRPLGILVLNKWAEQQFPHVDKMEWGGADSLLQWEENTFGLNHIEVSSFITRKWGFPAAVSDSIEKSTDQLASITESPMSLILQTAETLAESNRATFHAKQNGAPLRKERLDALGIKSVQLIEISRGALQHSRSFTA